MNDDLALTLLLADIDQVLTAHHADTAQVVAAGQTRLRLSESNAKIAFEHCRA